MIYRQFVLSIIEKRKDASAIKKYFYRKYLIDNNTEVCASIPENFNRVKHLVKVIIVAVNTGKTNIDGNDWQGLFFDLNVDYLHIKLRLVAQDLYKFVKLYWCYILRLSENFCCFYVFPNPNKQTGCMLIFF